MCFHRFKKEFWYSFVPIIIALALSYLLIPYCFGGRDVKFEEAALMNGTKSFFATVETVPIHFSSVRDMYSCLEGARERNAGRQALLFGNSQLHAVNQFQQGQENAPPVLFRYLREKGVDLITFSCPNINLQEYNAAFECLRKKIPIDYLILSLVFDDTRENGIRQVVKDIVKDKTNIDIKRGLDDTVGNKPMFAVAAQDISEQFLNKWLRTHWNIWRLRPQARGKLFLKLYHLRNFVLQINPQSKRPKIFSSYQANLKSLEKILTTTLKNEIKVLLYIAPIRNDVEIPYIKEQYVQFKKEVKELAVAYGAVFANLEDIVPAVYWGQKDSTLGKEQLELDFMHFQAQGHKLLAEKLGQIINDNFQPKKDLTQETLKMLKAQKR